MAALVIWERVSRSAVGAGRPNVFLTSEIAASHIAKLQAKSVNTGKYDIVQVPVTDPRPRGLDGASTSVWRSWRPNVAFIVWDRDSFSFVGTSQPLRFPDATAVAQHLLRLRSHAADVGGSPPIYDSVSVSTDTSSAGVIYQPWLASSPYYGS
jgi:hypothetical protein